jgi:perosamine synthetase
MIPVSIPNINGNEWKYIKECLDTGWVSSTGKYVEHFEEKIAEYTGANYAVACVNGTSALHISLRLAGVKHNDEVILPTLTFIAPVNAVRYNGAFPLFMDVDEYYNIDIPKTINYIKNETIYRAGDTYNKKSGRRISAIVPIHMWGNGVWLDELMPILKKRNIKVVEDASESMGTYYNNGKYKGYHTGTLGEFGCISFNGNKIITSGGGGMILTDSKQSADIAKYLTTQAKDDPVHYVHKEIGYNYRMSNIHAAMGLAQLEQLPLFIERKRSIYLSYKSVLDKVDGLSIAGVPQYSINNHWMVLIQINKERCGYDANKLMQKLLKIGIQTRPAWSLMHLQKPYLKCESYHIEKAIHLAASSLCLPSSTNLGNSDLEYVMEALLNV